MLTALRRDFAPKATDEEPDPRYIEVCHKLDYADYIYHTVFIDGCRDMGVQVKFYRDYRQEVARVEQLIRENFLAG